MDRNLKPGGCQTRFTYLYGYYPVHYKNLLLRYSGKVWRLWRKDPKIFLDAPTLIMMPLYFDEYFVSNISFN